MPGSKEIRTKIRSVSNTQKITRAMEMVAASKMKKAQERMRRARPYSHRIREVCAHMSRANMEYRHPFVVARSEVKNVGLITVTTDKGLCGGLNTNALRLALTKTKSWEDEGKGVKYTVFGSKGVAFLGRFGADIASQAVGLGDSPALEQLLGPVKSMFDLYENGDVDEVYMIYTSFLNTMKQEPLVEQLLPLSAEMISGEKGEDAQTATSSTWDYLYEPGAKEVVDVVLRRYVESVIYQAVSDNIASEQSARMVAMKAATDNAGKLIDELQLVYNKTRQAAITQEIAEIVGGASAV